MRGIKSKESGKWKRLAVFLILLLVFGVLLNSVRKVYQKKQAVQEVLARMEKEMFNLENRDKYLKDSLQKLTTQEGIELEIRKKLNVAQAGESIAIIVDEEQPAAATNTKISTWQKIKDFFTELLK
jgi:cell division protein FtsB